jgi:hypothetical protein
MELEEAEAKVACTRFATFFGKGVEKVGPEPPGDQH